MLAVWRFSRKATLRSSARLPGFLRAALLCRKENFAPAEAFRLGLFHPRHNTGRSCPYVSRKTTTKIQKALNPEPLSPLARDKSIFYRYCMAVGVPIPKLYALFFGRAAGWSFDGSHLASREDWWNFFTRQVPNEFVVKPSHGAYGKGLNIFSKSGQGFRDAFGRSYSLEELYGVLRAGPSKGGTIIQERLKNHPDLVRFSGTEFLQTVRIITLLRGADSCHILHAHFKPIVGQHIVDTYLDGLLGNVEATVNVEDGRLGCANQITDTGEGIRQVPTHPKTGAVFEGFQLPDWDRASDLARQTALKFWPLRTIGWDIALTPSGPSVIEANVWWDPPNQHETISSLMTALYAAADLRL